MILIDYTPNKPSCLLGVLNFQFYFFVYPIQILEYYISYEVLMYHNYKPIQNTYPHTVYVDYHN